MEAYGRNVFYYETDKMNYVHNSNYLRIFEEARIDHMLKSGIPYPMVEKSGILIPQVDAYVRYITPLRYGDAFICKVKVEEFSGVKIKYSYSMFRDPDMTAVANGWTEHCFLSEQTERPVSLKRNFPEIYEGFMLGLNESQAPSDQE